MSGKSQTYDHQVYSEIFVHALNSFACPDHLSPLDRLFCCCCWHCRWRAGNRIRGHLWNDWGYAGCGSQSNRMAIQNDFWSRKLVPAYQWLYGCGDCNCCLPDFEKQEMNPEGGASINSEFSFQPFYLIEQCLLPVNISIPLGAQKHTAIL
jgi:hypothetical protein